jgi:hypothetical protein
MVSAAIAAIDHLGRRCISETELFERSQADIIVAGNVKTPLLENVPIDPRDNFILASCKRTEP